MSQEPHEIYLLRKCKTQLKYLSDKFEPTITTTALISQLESFLESKSKISKKVRINIWDDFYNDKYIPFGEKQKTYIYVAENESEVNIDKQEEYLNFLLKEINDKLDVSGVVLKLDELVYPCKKDKNNPNSETVYPNPPFMREHYPETHKFSRWEIKVENLTHKRLAEWMQYFQNQKLIIDNVELEIISES